MAVRNTHAKYDEMAPLWLRMRDAAAGQHKVHAKGQAYLPMLKDQDEPQYNAYKKRASWFGATYRTITGLTGMLFRKPPRVVLPDAIKNMIIDINMAGVTLDEMVDEINEEILTVGRVGLLVDHPPIIDLDGAVLTLAQREATGIRPSIQLYKTESILNWKHRRVGLQWALSQVVLEECFKADKDEFTQTEETRWRVLDLDANDEYRQRVFRRDDKNEADEQVGEDVYPTIDGVRLNYIPFYSITPDGISMIPEEPPLMDLADLNFQHYRVTADYENGCHFCGLPTPVISGYTPESKEDGAPAEKLFVGSANAWVFPDPNAKATYLEFHGTGLNALKDNLDKKETQMAILGSRILAQDNKGRSNESATAVAVHRTGESSILSDIAQSVSTAIERALGVFVKWAATSGEVIYQVNRDFMPVVMDAQTMVALTNALTSGQISFETYWDMLQRGDIAALDVTAEQEKARILKNPEVPENNPAPPATNAPDKSPTQTVNAGGPSK